MKFKLKSQFKPGGDQPEAIKKLLAGLDKKYRDQTLLGVTGSGKTFTMANIVHKVQKPTLVMVHNKTLAAQLASEFRDFFPESAVHYFVSYYDYYQPEAYIPQTDTYIAKDASINQEIDRLRHAATSALLTRQDVLIVASVSAIYGLGDPELYQKSALKIRIGEKTNLQKFLRRLSDIQYRRNDLELTHGTFRARGDTVEIFTSYSEEIVRVEFFGDTIEKITIIAFLTGEVLGTPEEAQIFPAKHFLTMEARIKKAVPLVRSELKARLAELDRVGKIVEAQRLKQRTNYDLEMLQEVGYVSGIENYSRYLGDRAAGEQPATLLDYYPDDFLMFIDESHMTIPQIRGMYNGDRARKETLVEHGFRLPSAFDNRPLKFAEFDKHIRQVVYVSATPNEYELSKSKQVVEQIVRPTGLVDPEIQVRPTKNQIDDVLDEIQARIEKGERVLITTLTKKMAENLTEYIAEAGVKVQYLHSDVDTLDRIEILRALRLGEYDVVVGINLLREGLDLPEVSLVVILDADKAGFLRSASALIQTIGRSTRHINGRVIMYADEMTDAMRQAIDETARRREKQLAFNKKHGITPATIKKAIRDIGFVKSTDKVKRIKTNKLDKDQLHQVIEELENKMDLAAKNLEFEEAAELRDQIAELKGKL